MKQMRKTFEKLLVVAVMVWSVWQIRFSVQQHVGQGMGEPFYWDVFGYEVLFLLCGFFLLHLLGKSEQLRKYYEDL